MKLTDSELDRRLAALPRQADAPEELWPLIERRIRHRRRWPWMSGIAAAMVAAVLALSIVVDGPNGTTEFNAAATVFAAEAAAMGRAAPGHAEYVDAEFNSGWQEAWHENQAAIAELEQALKRNPDNRLLLDFLARARLRQSELINNAMAGGAMEDQRSISL